MAKIEDKVEELIKGPIENIGYTVYDVIYTKEGKDNYLKIFIDNEIGISLDDCEKVNNTITDMLDEANYIKEQYYLEISSPGIERVIRKDKHLEQNIGQQIDVKTFVAVDETKKKEFIGELKNFDKDSITIKYEDKELKIERKDIALIKKMYEWN